MKNVVKDYGTIDTSLKTGARKFSIQYYFRTKIYCALELNSLKPVEVTNV